MIRDHTPARWVGTRSSHACARMHGNSFYLKMGKKGLGISPSSQGVLVVPAGEKTVPPFHLLFCERIT